MNELVLPTNKLSQPTTDYPVVLLSTGAFAPIHEGHVEMMILAKKKLEESGREVIGGYMSPDNRVYLKEKSIDSYISDADRISACEKIVENIDWLMIDKTSVYYDVDQFFTKVIKRIKGQLPYKTTIAYVYGSDKSYFSMMLTEENIGVCVERGIAKDSFESDKDIQFQNVVYVKGGEHLNKQSTDIRKLVKEKPIQEKSKYIIRNDLEFLVPKTEALDRFTKTIQKLIQERVPENVCVEIQDAAEQIEKARKKLNGRKCISLDVHFKGNHDIELTRLFDVCDGQLRSKKLISRSKESILTQIKRIPKGDYVLVEDDSATGETIRRIKSLLSKRGINITEVILLFNQTGEKIYDVVDMRDFLIGSYQSGLTVRLFDGTIAKAPYCLPYVSLSSRAKLNEERVASYEIYRANVEYYREVSPNIQLKNMFGGFIKLMKAVGSSEETALAPILTCHMDLLGRSYAS